MLRLGKLPAEHDRYDRTIKFRSILKKRFLPPIPDEWRFYEQYPQFDLSPRMWRNDQIGDCVEVASYAQQREFEVVEQNKLIEIDEDQLVKQYQKESGGDYGLVMLEHMKLWRNDGIPIGFGRKLLCLKMNPVMHKIDAFTRIDPQDPKEIKYAILLTGCNMGFCMPDNFGDEFNSGKPWQDISLLPNQSNGHAMKLGGWTKEGLILWTWGKWQLAKWPWVLKYADEGWAMIDAINSWLGDKSPLDMDKLRGYLEQITK